MRLIATACVLIAMALASAHAREFDPTEQILPFASEAQLIADGDFAEAIDALAARAAAIDTGMTALGINWSDVARDDPRMPHWLIGLINLNQANHLICYATGGRMDDNEVIATCVENWQRDVRMPWCLARTSLGKRKLDLNDCLNSKTVVSDSWSPYFVHLTEAMVNEAEGEYERAIRAYEDGAPLSKMIDRNEGLLFNQEDDTISAAMMIDDYVHFRQLRLILAVDDKPFRNTDPNIRYLDCPIHLWFNCPGAVEALKGMIQFIKGYRLRAGDLLAISIERPQRWLGLDAYEHPLFWIAASDHRDGDRSVIDLALRYQPELGDAITPDVRYVLDLYAGDAMFDGTIPNACDTPGCRYFLAQHLYGDGRSGEAHAVMSASAPMCHEVESLMCSVLRFANLKIEAGGMP